MKPNTFQMLDLSTGHLSLATREWMELEGVQKTYSIMSREEGFVMSTHWATDDGRETLGDNFPFDLLHCLRFAEANGSSYLMFDCDAELDPRLPEYDDASTKPVSFGSLSKDLFIEMPGPQPDDDLSWHVVDTDQVPRNDLIVEQTWTDSIPDADFDAPDGCWIGIADASIRLKADEEGDVSITAFKDGDEMGVPFFATKIAHEDLAKDDEPELN